MKNTMLIKKNMYCTHLCQSLHTHGYGYTVHYITSLPNTGFHDSVFKAIGGVRVKKFMLILSKRSSWGGTNTFYGKSKLIFVQKLSHFEIHDIGRISYKKIGKISILGYFIWIWTSLSIFVLWSWNLHHIFLISRQKK